MRNCSVHGKKETRSCLSIHKECTLSPCSRRGQGHNDGTKRFWLLPKFVPHGAQQFPEEQSQTGRFQTRLQSLSNGFRAGNGLQWSFLCRYLSLLLHLFNMVFAVGRSLYSSRLPHVTSAQGKTVSLLTQKGCFLILVLLRLCVLGEWGITDYLTGNFCGNLLLLIGLAFESLAIPCLN